MPHGFHLDNLVRSGTKQPYPITISAEGLARPLSCVPAYLVWSLFWHATDMKNPGIGMPNSMPIAANDRTAKSGSA